jgi:hypothetical protein
MAIRLPGALAVMLSATSILPAIAQDRLDLSLQAPEHPGVRLSVGSIGPDSRAGVPARPDPRDNPYHYFLVPAERPPETVPGFLFRIPIGGGGSQGDAGRH